MADNVAEVKIVGDASGVAPAAQEAGDAVATLGPILEQLTAGFAELSALMRESMAEGAAGTAEMAAEMQVLIGETEKESLSLKEVAVAAREGAEAMIAMRESVMGIGELIMGALAVEAIMHFAEGIGEAAEKTFHLSQQLGLTIAQTQSLKAAAAATGVSFDALTKAMGILDKNFETKPKLFQDLGIEIPRNADQMTLLNAVMDKFERTADGPNKTALALALMGRAGKEMIPFMNEGSAGLSELIQKAHEYGAVNVEAAEKGVKLAESLNEGKLAMDGLKLTLSDAFAPLLTELIDGFNGLVKSLTESYREGGAVKIIFEGIVDIFTGIGEVLTALAQGFAEAFGGMGADSLDWATIVKGVIEGVVLVIKVLIAAVVGVADVFKFVFDAVIGQLIQWYGEVSQTFSNVRLAIDVLKQLFVTLGTVVYDALTLNWGSIASDWDAGMAQIVNVVQKRGAEIVADAKATHDQAQAWFTASQNVASGYGSFLTDLFKQQDAPKETGIKLPKTGGEGGGDLSTAGKKGKKEKDDLVQRLDDELTAKKLAWSMEQDAEGTAIAYSLQAEADYWKEILNRTDLSAKDRAAIETKYLAAHTQLVKERIAVVIDGYKQEIAEADKNAAEKLEIANRELAYIGKTFGTESKEYAQAQAEIVRIKREAAEQIRQLDEIHAQSVDKANLDAITTEEALAKQRVAMGVETNQQLLAQETDFENRRYAIEAAAAARARALVDPQKDPVRAAQLDAQLEQLERQHQQKLTQIDQQAVLQRSAIERTAANSVASLWGQNLAKMITLQQSFSTTVRSLYLGMVDIISTALASVIEKWIEQQLAAFLFKRTAQAADGVASVTSNAAVAGSAAFASIAAIPIVGPELAPAAAAAAFAGAMSFAPIASAAGGDWDVTEGLYQLHTKEMVLPEWAATPLRAMLGGGAANTNAPEAANGNRSNGGDHYHIHAIDVKGIKRLLDDHAPAVGTAVRKYVRNGGKTTPP